MKLLLFVALICIRLGHVSLQQQQEREKENLEKQIQKLQIQVEQQFQYLKRVKKKFEFIL